MEERVFEFVGGRPCLDFTNTVGGDRRTAPREDLPGYPDLVSWARQGGLITAAQARALLLRAQREPAAAARTLAAAVELRESIFRIFNALAEKKRPAEADLEALNRALAASLPHRRLVHSGREFALGWAGSDELDRMLWPVVEDAAELLAHGEQRPIRMCGASDVTGCSWLFIDETRNRSRRWCTMKDCGNVAKARRHYQRVKNA